MNGEGAGTARVSFGAPSGSPRSPKKRGPFQFVRAGDFLGDCRQARISLALRGKSVGGDENLIQFAAKFADDDRADFQVPNRRAILLRQRADEFADMRREGRVDPRRCSKQTFPTQPWNKLAPAPEVITSIGKRPKFAAPIALDVRVCQKAALNAQSRRNCRSFGNGRDSIALRVEQGRDIAIPAASRRRRLIFAEAQSAGIAHVSMASSFRLA
ncbi:hypothetical protein [Rhodoblastus sp.]|uniref:hypothetical protein n=1 Tax=Rhodoblastus sp. TaxID=1962975 RepID=UPI003F9AEE6F